MLASISDYPATLVATQRRLLSKTRIGHEVHTTVLGCMEEVTGVKLYLLTIYRQRRGIKMAYVKKPLNEVLVFVPSEEHEVTVYTSM